LLFAVGTGSDVETGSSKKNHLQVTVEKVAEKWCIYTVHSQLSVRDDDEPVSQSYEVSTGWQSEH